MGQSIGRNAQTMAKVLAVICVCIAVSIAYESEDSVTPLEDMAGLALVDVGKGGTSTAKNAEKDAKAAEQKADATKSKANAVVAKAKEAAKATAAKKTEEKDKA